jgi:hypothetical protein
MKEELTASIVFSSMTVFDMVQRVLHGSAFFMNNTISGRVSIDRVNEFLNKVRRACISSTSFY